jgi:hypothetical protein
MLEEECCDACMDTHIIGCLFISELEDIALSSK